VKHTLLAATLALALAPALLAHDAARAEPPGIATLAVDETMTVDALGDATFEISFALTAAQMRIFGQSIRTNASMAKRDWMKLLSQYETSDWDLRVDDMTRRVTIRAKGHGAVAHPGGGAYALTLPQAFRGGEPHGTAIDFNFIAPLNPALLGQFNLKVVLPPEATDVTSTVAKNGGQRVVGYRVPIAGAAGAAMRVLLVAGLVVTALGLGLTILALVRRRAARAPVGPAPA
jgi:hypothetical protein